MDAPYLEEAALRRAFARVRDNHGCAGADGVGIGDFERAWAGQAYWLQGSVRDGSYYAWPLRRIEIEKKPGSTERRTLLVPAVRDRVLQTAVAAYLEPLLEPEFNACSFGYRRGRSVRMAVERVYALYQEGYNWLLDADVDDFFNSVASDVVMARLNPLVRDETVLALVRQWLDYAVWDGVTFRRPGVGLPQGSVVSPMLANLCLDVLDDRLEGAGLKLVRYADDFVVLTKSRKAAERAYALTEQTLGELRLKLKESKTRIVRFSEGFRFLGVIYLKDLLVQPFPTGRKKLKILSMAGPWTGGPLPDGERRALRRYRSC